MSNKLKASAKLSLLAAGVLASGSVSANAMEVNIFDYETMGNGNDVRSELLNPNSVDYIASLAGTESKLQEGKCGEGKCGEGKCGEGVEKNKEVEKKGNGEEVEKKGNGEEEEGVGTEEGTEEGSAGKEGEHKCGEGKCGEGACGK
jgi:hypothetical protein